MYVCICNAVTEDDVRGCLDGGACSPKDIKAACGMRPGCGSCTKRLYTLVSEYRTASDLVDAITGGPASPVMPAERTEPMPIAGPTLAVGPSTEPLTTGPFTTGPLTTGPLTAESFATKPFAETVAETVAAETAAAEALADEITAAVSGAGTESTGRGSAPPNAA